MQVVAEEVVINPLDQLQVVQAGAVMVEILVHLDQMAGQIMVVALAQVQDSAVRVHLEVQV
jgi:hypothetical protein